MVADFNVRCFDDRWDTYMWIGIFMIIVYPFGIPFTFWRILFRNRRKLGEPDVRAKMGFLYDAYHYEVWWFEMVRTKVTGHLSRCILMGSLIV